MRLATYTELESYTRIKRGTLHWLVSTAQIPHIRLGPRLVRFDLDQIDRWLAERVRGVGGEGGTP